MGLELSDCSFFGSALPEPFVKSDLEQELKKKKILPENKGNEGKTLQSQWEKYRKKLRDLGPQGGKHRVKNHVIDPLLEILGYTEIEVQENVITREGEENGGWLLKNANNGKSLRYWTEEIGTDLDAPQKRGKAYRFSPNRIAQRVLLAKKESIGLLTDGEELRILLCDPARPESHIVIRLDRSGGWSSQPKCPDSFRLFLALCRPEGIEKLSDIINDARLKQSKVTTTLREQAKRAIQEFLQNVLEHPENISFFATKTDKESLSKELWSEGLVFVYRLLFILKLESSPDSARAFSFASTSLWRHTYSPNIALAPYVNDVLSGIETGGMLEGGLRVLFKMFAEGLACSELKVSPLGGMLFGKGTTPVLETLKWGEKAIALLLENLLWAPGEKKKEQKVRVHYGALDVEDLGRVYEALLELEPGISTVPMCLLRRDKLEIVVPATQGERYQDNPKKTKVEWIKEIPSNHFYLRVGLGRKATGSYYTPHGFVRFLVQETLEPQILERSPTNNPKPSEILKLKVLDPAMGSGHFLVEACRYLGDKLYEICRLCDEMASKEEEKAEQTKDPTEKKERFQRVAELRKRLEDLPDPEDELLSYLPSRAVEGEELSLSETKAQALCRRLVAVHCLYGVDKNPLAVELAKLALWLESYAEGLPLTFLDHRLICGDSLTGPFFEQLLTYPISGDPIQGVSTQGLKIEITNKLYEALKEVRELEATIGKNVAELEQKRNAKEKLATLLEPFKILASIWSGCILSSVDKAMDSIYETALKSISNLEELKTFLNSPEVYPVWEKGKHSIPYDIYFPEVFYPDTDITKREGFHAILGNPPWDTLQPLAKEFFAAFDLNILDAPTRLERKEIEEKLLSFPETKKSYEEYVLLFDQMKYFVSRIYKYVNRQAGGAPSGAVTDLWQIFAERALSLLQENAFVGYVLPSAFHANQSATGMRALYLSQFSIRHCYSFENRKNLFEIDNRFKFIALVAQKSTTGTQQFPCAFYLHDIEWLFQKNKPFIYTKKFIQQTGGDYLSFIELQSPLDERVAKTCFKTNIFFGKLAKNLNIHFAEEMHMSKDAYLFTPTHHITKEDPRQPDVSKNLLDESYLTLHEGKTFHQYNDTWGERPRYIVNIEKISDKKIWIKCAQYYRLVFRRIASSTNERTFISFLAPPKFLFADNSRSEHTPFLRSNSLSLYFVSLFNSFVFDFLIRLYVQASINLFVLNGSPLPSIQRNKSIIEKFLIHSALRLTCNSQSYEALWKEQLGETWRETSSNAFSFPVLSIEKERWQIRARIDAVVAKAYGLDRELYQHVLSTFSHTSFSDAPKFCLEAFDELQQIGEDVFCKKYDPYWNIPINETLPEPVIEISIPETKPTKTIKKQKGKKQLSFLDEEEFANENEFENENEFANENEFEDEIK